MEPHSQGGVHRGRSRDPGKGSRGDPGGFGGAGSSPEASQKSTLGALPQKAPGVVVTTQGAKEVLGTHKAPTQKALPETPQVLVRTGVPQEAKQGVLQDPQATTNKIPSDLQTHFSLVFSMVLDTVCLHSIQTKTHPC